MYFIANFQYLTDQQKEDETERRHGVFSMMIQASSSQEALDKFRERLVSFRQSDTFFQGRCKIFISQLLEFDSIPSAEAVMLNFKSFAGDPVMPFIGCIVPTESSNACAIHEWKQNQPMTEGKEDSLFLAFE